MTGENRIRRKAESPHTNTLTQVDSALYSTITIGQFLLERDFHHSSNVTVATVSAGFCSMIDEPTV